MAQRGCAFEQVVNTRGTLKLGLRERSHCQEDTTQLKVLKTACTTPCRLHGWQAWQKPHAV